MKLYKLLFLVPAIVLQMGCGKDNGSNNNNANCAQNTAPYQNGAPQYQQNGQPIQNTCGVNGYAVSQTCVGPYYWCGGAASNVNIASCMANPQNEGYCQGTVCRGYQMVSPSGQQVLCQ